MSDEREDDVTRSDPPKDPKGPGTKAPPPGPPPPPSRPKSEPDE